MNIISFKESSGKTCLQRKAIVDVVSFFCKSTGIVIEEGRRRGRRVEDGSRQELSAYVAVLLFLSSPVNAFDWCQLCFISRGSTSSRKGDREGGFKKAIERRLTKYQNKLQPVKAMQRWMRGVK